MGPISPVSIGQAGASAGTASILNRPTDAAAMDAGRTAARLTPSNGPTDSLAVNNLNSAISDLLQGLGGGLEDDKVLRMMIALIILLALLQSSQGGAASDHNTLAPLGLGGNAQPQSVGIYSSSTTIAIQQTTTTMVLHSVESYSTASTDNPVDSQGGQIDLSA